MYFHSLYVVMGLRGDYKLLIHMLQINILYI